MIVDVIGNILTVHHTEVIPEDEGKGHARQLLNSMVAYVREHRLTVLPLCPYVLAQFRRTLICIRIYGTSNQQILYLSVS